MCESTNICFSSQSIFDKFDRFVALKIKEDNRKELIQYDSLLVMARVVNILLQLRAVRLCAQPVEAVECPQTSAC